MIGTYALLGFSSLSSIGVNIGILGALAPQRRNDVASLAIRAIINGNLASLLTACLAGEHTIQCLSNIYAVVWVCRSYKC